MLLTAILALTGCAKKPVRAPVVEIIVHKDCVKDLECRGPNRNQMHCKLELITGCEEIHISENHVSEK